MSTPEERRRHPRLTLQERAVVHRSRRGDDSPFPQALYGNTLDVSPAGMQLVLKQALLPGEPVDVVVHVQGHKDLFHLSGETRWIAPVSSDKTYRLGIEIDGKRSRDYGAWQQVFAR
jgi:hypothetical protein